MSATAPVADAGSSRSAPSALYAATGNSILSTPVSDSQVAVDIGRYVYVTGAQRFEG